MENIEPNPSVSDVLQAVRAILRVPDGASIMTEAIKIRRHADYWEHRQEDDLPRKSK